MPKALPTQQDAHALGRRERLGHAELVGAQEVGHDAQHPVHERARPHPDARPLPQERGLTDPRGEEAGRLEVQAAPGDRRRPTQPQSEPRARR